MGKQWNVCWICGHSWSSIIVSVDCGKNDEQHKNAREGR